MSVRLGSAKYPLFFRRIDTWRGFDRLGKLQPAQARQDDYLADSLPRGRLSVWGRPHYHQMAHAA